jgi:outer membrane protein TolC
VLEDVGEGRLDPEKAVQRLEEVRYGLDSAQEAVRIARLRYRNGLGTNVELLDSEAAFTSAQQEQVTARYRYQQTLARYRRATAQAILDKDGGVL